MKPAPTRLWDFPSALLLTLALMAAAQRLVTTSWAPGLGIVLVFTLLGGCLGMALGVSNFKPRAVTWLAIGYSLALIPLVTGGMLYHQTPWLERMASLGGRLGYSSYLMATSQPVVDTALFVVVMGLGFWVISLLAGYGLTRRGDFVLAIAPAGVATFIIQLFDSRIGDRVVVLAVYTFLALLLLGRLNYVRKNLRWKETRVSISAESGMDLNLAIPMAALALVLLAWLVPVSAHPVQSARVVWENITRPLRQTRDDLNNAFAGLKGKTHASATEFYGSTLALGLAAPQSETVYLRIHVPVTQSADRYYWRVRVYDQYVDNKWQSKYIFDEPFSPDQSPLSLADANGQSSEFIFTTPQTNLGVLVTPAHPLWVSRPTTLTFTPSVGKNVDPLLFSVDPPVLAGEQYTVHANIYNPTIDQLQKAGVSYPAWVRDHYLQLPVNLSPQITDLARSLIAGLTTPYDKTVAITQYLRDNITYTATIEPPPTGADPLTWFLFGSRKGFCDYYASAEVIMLRSLGIPARLVVGFAQGEFEAPDWYTVRDKDAHAWPEVYFPGIGWVEFEPTSGQPALVRAATAADAGDQTALVPDLPGVHNTGQYNPADVETGGSTKTKTSRPANSLLRLTVIVLALILGIIGVSVAYSTGLLDRAIKRTRLVSLKPLPVMLANAYAGLSLTPPGWLTRWAYFSGLGPVERAFGVVYQSLRWLREEAAPSRTPAEAAARLEWLLPEVSEQIRALAFQYERAVFSIDHYDLDIARQSIKPIRRQALRAAFQMRLADLKDAPGRLFRRRSK